MRNNDKLKRLQEADGSTGTAGHLDLAAIRREQGIEGEGEGEEGEKERNGGGEEEGSSGGHVSIMHKKRKGGKKVPAASLKRGVHLNEVPRDQGFTRPKVARGDGHHHWAASLGRRRVGATGWEST